MNPKRAVAHLREAQRHLEMAQQVGSWGGKKRAHLIDTHRQISDYIRHQENAKGPVE